MAKPRSKLDTAGLVGFFLSLAAMGAGAVMTQEQLQYWGNLLLYGGLSSAAILIVARLAKFLWDHFHPLAPERDGGQTSHQDVGRDIGGHNVVNNSGTVTINPPLTTPPAAPPPQTPKDWPSRPTGIVIRGKVSNATFVNPRISGFEVGIDDGGSGNLFINPSISRDEDDEKAPVPISNAARQVFTTLGNSPVANYIVRTWQTENDRMRYLITTFAIYAQLIGKTPPSLEAIPIDREIIKHLWWIEGTNDFREVAHPKNIVFRDVAITVDGMIGHINFLRAQTESDLTSGQL